MRWFVTVCMTIVMFGSYGYSQDSTTVSIPPLKGRINDYAGILNEQTKSTLETKLAQLEKEDSTQVVVATVSSIGDEDIESYSIRLAETWKIGQKGLDNGVIILVAHDNRQVRIEVGKGLEGTFTDLLAGRIIDYIMIPHFKNGDYDTGISQAVDAIIDIVKGTFDASTLEKKKSVSDYATFFWIAFIFMIMVGSLGRLLSGIVSAIALPIIGLFFSFGLPVLVILAVVGFFVGFILASTPFIGSRGGFGGGGFLSGGFSSGGGFIGGGGSFGGGGASGSW